MAPAARHARGHGPLTPPSLLLPAARRSDAPATAAAVQAELKVSADAIGKNPKSYPAWHHRQWTVERFRTHVDCALELALCGQLLDADERNFHCWNYRRWLAVLAGVPPADELAYTAQRIRTNFSNYSAWHYRTVLLPALAAAGAGAEPPPHAAAAPAAPHAPLLAIDTLRAELELLRQAVFTEPDDQSPWFYRRWVLGQLQRHFLLPPAAPAGDERAPRPGGGGGEEPEAAAALVEQDVALLRELAAVEPASKWPLVGIAQALQVLALRPREGGSGGDDAAALAAADELRGLYARLVDMDPPHAGYYRYCELALQAGDSGCSS